MLLTSSFLLKSALSVIMGALQVSVSSRDVLERDLAPILLPLPELGFVEFTGVSLHFSWARSISLPLCFILTSFFKFIFWFIFPPVGHSLLFNSFIKFSSLSVVFRMYLCFYHLSLSRNLSLEIIVKTHYVVCLIILFSAVLFREK